MKKGYVHASRSAQAVFMDKAGKDCSSLKVTTLQAQKPVQSWRAFLRPLTSPVLFNSL